MNRQKALLIKTANSASNVALRVRRSLRLGDTIPSTELDSVRRRLELLLAAMYGHAIRIEGDEAARRPNWLGRVLSGGPRNAFHAAEAGSNDGVVIRLPRSLRDADTLNGAAGQYRLLAVEHAERIARNTAALVPGDDKPLERDLYLLAESAAVDRILTNTMGGIADLIRNTRRSALASRPASRKLSVTEQQVEILAQSLLSCAPEELPPEFGTLDSPADSLTWARATANEIRANARGSSTRYRGVAPVPLWGSVRGANAAVAAKSEEERILDALNSAAMLDTHIALEDRAGSSSGGSEADRASPDGASDSVGDAAPETEEEVDATAESAASGAANSSDDIQGQFNGEGDAIEPDLGATTSSLQNGIASPTTPGAIYPEWDCNLGEYRKQGATVRQVDPPEGSLPWVDRTLAEHSVLVRRVRRRFEMLRARRIQMPRQRDGDELDLAACVRALIDLRTGHSADDRLYVATRPARRDIAITILVDVSGSTADPVTDAVSVIDVEKVALLLASEAIDALGDMYSILTFSSYGAADVRVTNVKDFRERNSDMVHRRISAIAPQGKTRLGAAVRHATSHLISQPVGHRLLLILSDGRPNDTDRYFETYAAEDTRRAILEARASDVYPFCITVDSGDEAEEYLSHIFGAAGHTILRQPDQLPLALLKGVQQLLAS